MNQSLLFLGVLILAGCVGVYPYNVINDGCWCERFVQSDLGDEVVYIFSARYRVDESIRTTIEVEFHNNSNDTLYLSGAHIKVSSRNVHYQYNNMFLPIMLPSVPPGGQNTLTLTGESASRTGDDLWLKIAGEELTLTMSGMALGDQLLDGKVIKLIPHNPKLGS